MLKINIFSTQNRIASTQFMNPDTFYVTSNSFLFLYSVQSASLAMATIMVTDGNSECPHMSQLKFEFGVGYLNISFYGTARNVIRHLHRIGHSI